MINTIFYFPDSLTFDQYLNKLDQNSDDGIASRTIVLAKQLGKIYNNGRVYGTNVSDVQQLIEQNEYDDQYITEAIETLQRNLSNNSEAINLQGEQFTALTGRVKRIEDNGYVSEAQILTALAGEIDGSTQKSSVRNKINNLAKEASSSLFTEVYDYNHNITAQSIVDAIVNDNSARAELASHFTAGDNSMWSGVLTEADLNTATSSLFVALSNKANDDEVVKKASIIASINNSGESGVSINADKINLNGNVIAQRLIAANAAIGGFNITNYRLASTIDRVGYENCYSELQPGMIFLKTWLTENPVDTFENGNAHNQDVVLINYQGMTLYSQAASGEYSTMRLFPNKGFAITKGENVENVGVILREDHFDVSPDEYCPVYLGINGEGWLANGSVRWNANGNLGLTSGGIILDTSMPFAWDNSEQPWNGLGAVIVGKNNSFVLDTELDYNEEHPENGILTIETHTYNNAREIASALGGAIVDTSGNGITLFTPQRLALDINDSDVWPAIGINYIYPHVKLHVTDLYNYTPEFASFRGGVLAVDGSDLLVSGRIFSTGDMHCYENCHAYKFIKDGGTDQEVLLAGGGTKALSEFSSGGGSSSVDWSNVQNKPTNVSAFTNDAGYLTSHQSLAGYLPLAGGILTGTLTVNNDFVARTIQSDGIITGTQFQKSNGTSNQFLKADGSVDSNTYALASSLNSYLPLVGGSLTGDLDLGSHTLEMASGDYSSNLDFNSLTFSHTEGSASISMTSTDKFLKLTGGKILLSGDAVGIGVANPTYKLDVGGNAHTSGNLTVDGTVSVSAGNMDIYSAGQQGDLITAFDAKSGLKVLFMGGASYNFDNSVRAGSFVKLYATSDEVLMADGSTMTLAELKAALEAI